MRLNKSGFTLIEVLVSVSILSVIMVSIFAIFQLASDLNNKTDVSRSMQENIKNIVELIAEDVRKNGINGVNSNIIIGDCSFSDSDIYTVGTKLCVGGNSYYIAKDVGGVWNRVGDYSECDGKTQCFLVRNDGTSVTQLSNSWVDFKDLSFSVSKDGMRKVTINFIIEPSMLKGIKQNLVKENKIVFQTTISGRLYSDY